MSIIEKMLGIFEIFFKKNDGKTTSEKVKTTKTEKEEVKSEEKVMTYKISMKEILKSADFESQPDYIKNALEILIERINQIRDAYGKPMIVTSGLRTLEDHLRIYKEKGITDQSKIPMKSKHLMGKAVDIYDPNKDLQKWCKENEVKLEEFKLWMEDFSATPNWCHFQTEPPASGKRWFLP